MRLREYQQAMANYLRELDSSVVLSTISPAHKIENCLQIYRNHYLISLIDAITATFPATREYLGEQYFYTKVRSYVLAHPPVSGCLANYGEDFPRWLGNEKLDVHGAQDLATLEWNLERAGMAPLPKPFPFQSLAELSPEQYENVYFHLAVGVCVLSANWDVVSLYDHIKNNDISNKDSKPDSAVSEQFSWLLYRKPEGVGVYPADTFFSSVIRICQLGQSLSTLENDLSPEHLQAIFFMVENGIIDSFDILDNYP